MAQMAAVSRIDRQTNIHNLSKRTTIRNLTIFTVVVLASGWIGRALDMLMGNPGSDTLGQLLWLVTPFPLSLLLRALAGDGWKDFGIKLNLRGNWAWYAVAILVYPVVTALVLIIGRGLGLIAFPSFSLDALLLMLQAFALGFLPLFIKNILEEGAWRGYLAPKIFSLRLNDFVGHTTVGLIWGAWHLPYYLFFLAPAYLQEFTTLNLAVYIPLVMLVFISWAMVYGEIRLLTHSVWPALLMHAIEDVVLLQLFEGRFIEIVPGTDWLISPMNGIVMVFFFAALGVGLRQLRKRKLSVV